MGWVCGRAGANKKWRRNRLTPLLTSLAWLSNPIILVIIVALRALAYKAREARDNNSGSTLRSAVRVYLGTHVYPRREGPSPSRAQGKVFRFVECFFFPTKRSDVTARKGPKLD